MQQLTLSLEEGLLERHESLSEVMAQCIYSRGLARMAEKLHTPKGNLSRMLDAQDERKFGIDDLEQYMQATGDTTPALWIAAKYLGDKGGEDAARAQRLEGLMAEMAVLIGQAKGKRK
jgi:hypothetical protein